MIRENSEMHSQVYRAPAVPDPSTPAEETDRDHPTTPLMSVELPRWIDHPRVDSQAMLSAFLDYRNRLSGESRKQLEHIYMIVHTQESTFVTGNKVIQPQEISPLPTRPCKERECERCRTRRGGYQFKWFHARWENVYIRLSREGAWTPDRLEGMTSEQKDKYKRDRTCEVQNVNNIQAQSVLLDTRTSQRRSC